MNIIDVIESSVDINKEILSFKSKDIDNNQLFLDLKKAYDIGVACYYQTDLIFLISNEDETLSREICIFKDTIYILNKQLLNGIFTIAIIDGKKEIIIYKYDTESYLNINLLSIDKSKVKYLYNNFQENRYGELIYGSG